ncbi:MAG: transglycosylase domain-containing protein [Clostridia bacterium]|nr:transglycosylase domain-containing protein [Clostridia bacterium]
MKQKNKKAKGMEIFKRITIFSLATAVVLLVLALSVGAYVYNHIDYTADEALFEMAKGERTTKIYYNGGDNASFRVQVKPSVLPSGYHPVEWEEQRIVGREGGVFCTYEDIPQNLKDAFVAIEDKRFFSHEGVDWWRTGKAALNYLLHFDGRFGGSSITQQLIKNISADNELTASRKIREICRAIHLEKNHSKEEILELYMNIIPMSQGCVGVGAAAEIYFGKSVGELTLAESATVAAVTNSPVRYDPVNNPENNQKRRDLILSEMRKQGMIDEEECLAAQGVPVEVNSSNKDSAKIYSWYTETVIADVVTDLSREYGLSRTAAEQMVFGGGLSIYTQMNKDAQQYLENFFSDYENFPTALRGGLCMSMVITDPQTGDLLALVGGVGKKTENRILNYATAALRAPGSAIKPLSVYAPALEEGLVTWGSVFDDVPVTFSKTSGGYTAWPHNFPAVYSGLTDLRAAVAHSKNTVAVRILERLGKELSFSYLSGKLGLTTLVRSREGASGGRVTDLASAPLALGQLTDGVSLRALTNAYGALANTGVYNSSRSYSVVLDRHGNVLLSNRQTGKRVFSGETAYLTTELLRGVTEEGTASAVTLKKIVPVAAKTGTSGNTCDKWLVGYTPYAVAGIWCGYEDGVTPVPNEEAKTHISVWDQVMHGLHNGRLLSEKRRTRVFETPHSIVRVAYCRDSGLLPCEACRADPRGERIVYGYFVKGSEPKRVCDRHVLVEYDEIGGGIATDKCPEDNIKEIGLLQKNERNFPADVFVSDSQYEYIPTDEEKDLPGEVDVHHGTSRASDDGAFNRPCPLEHEEYEDDGKEIDPFEWLRRYFKKDRKIS